METLPKTRECGYLYENLAQRTQPETADKNSANIVESIGILRADFKITNAFACNVDAC